MNNKEFEGLLVVCWLLVAFTLVYIYEDQTKE